MRHQRHGRSQNDWLSCSEIGLEWVGVRHFPKFHTLISLDKSGLFSQFRNLANSSPWHRDLFHPILVANGSKLALVPLDPAYGARRWVHDPVMP